MVAMVVPPTIQIASIGIPDTLFLMLLALVVFGPRRLPEIGRQIGKLMYEFRKVSNDFKFQMEEELRASEEADRQAKLQASLPPPAPASTQLTLDVPPHPVSAEPAPDMDFGHGMKSVTAHESATEAEIITEPGTEPGEVHGIPIIQPPATGEVVAAAKPFRGREPEAAMTGETVTESGSEPTHTATTPVVVADEGRVGTEVQPGVEAAAERETHHA
jgi:sec-independent protein translocase protein TatB